jgi:hypothetical protein
MKKNNYSARLRKALNNETKNIDILDVISKKELCTKRDVLNLTGICSRDYDYIFAEKEHPSVRFIRFDFGATCALSDYATGLCGNLEPHQKVVFELLWKWVKGEAVSLISQQFNHITGRFIEEDYYDDEAFWEETYEITEEELAEAAEVVKKHLAEVSETPNAA